MGLFLLFAVPAKALAQATPDGNTSAQSERRNEAPPPEFTTWSWPKRIAFVALIMGSIVIVSNTLGKYEWPEEWGGRPKPGGRSIIPEKIAEERKAARAKKEAEKAAAEAKAASSAKPPTDQSPGTGETPPPNAERP